MNPVSIFRDSACARGADYQQSARVLALEPRSQPAKSKHDAKKLKLLPYLSRRDRRLPRDPGLAEARPEVGAELSPR